MYKHYQIKLNEGTVKLNRTGDFVYTQNNKHSFNGILVLCIKFRHPASRNRNNKSELVFRKTLSSSMVLFLGEL